MGSYVDDLLPQFPIDYVPEVVEFYDELGLLIRIEQMKIVHQIERPEDLIYRYISVYFDGYLGLVVNPQTKVLTRVENMQVFGEIVKLAQDYLP